MRIRWKTLLVAAALASAPAAVWAAQSETQEREAAQDSDLLYNILGCLGLLGLFGIQRPHDNDGYTDDPI